jgi:endoglucanase
MVKQSVPLCVLTIGLVSFLGACADDTGLFVGPGGNRADAAVPDSAAVGAPDLGNVGKKDGGVAPDVGPLEGVLIDDFEDGDGKTTLAGGAWYSYDDQANGGGSTIDYVRTADGLMMNGPGFESTRSMEVLFSFDQGSLPYEPYVGWGAWLADKPSPFDASAYVGIAYTYRGSAHRVRVETFEVTDYDFLGMDLASSADWKTVVVPFGQLSQEGWGIHVAFNPKSIGNISFQSRGGTGSQGKVDIDNLMFLTRLPDQPPDMTVMQPAIPADTPITSIAITHPGQALALASLDRGYNLANWLEQDPFTGFLYDEAYVKKLAAAGFKSLRLPIDLDRYVVSSSGAGAATDVVVDEDLFLVLDAFAAWTANAGLSLTIDYHQYDTSLDKAKPASIDRAVAVWGKVAARYASNPRQDLFYELLNEPELSFGGTPPTQDEWTAIAERMVAAIRASDKLHSIIFGDVNWYGINMLMNRKPLSDGNVIYAFHDYEPFIFTHQGASWAGMAPTHDIPYPYSAERWSPYFGDLGFNTTMESWILSSARDYYRTGNRAAIRNAVVAAKRWAVANNVPVICNEFGVYDRTARLEDRARYLTDVVSVFEELQIPWQQWFAIMDNAGNVLPEYRAALRLGQ